LDKTEIRDFQLRKGKSAETSGGLLITFKENDALSFIQEMREKGEIANIIGEVIKGNKEVLIEENIEFINI